MKARRPPGILPENVHWLEGELEEMFDRFFQELAETPENVVWTRKISPHTFRMMAKAAMAVLEAQQLP